MNRDDLSRRRILVNGRFLGRPTTGVERYARDILDCWRDRAHVLAPGSHRRGIGGHLWEQLALPQWVGEGDLLWSPGNTGPLAVSNQVVTIHDLSVFEYPEGFDRKFAAWYRFLLPRLAHRARKVITDSEFSRGRILEVFGLPQERVVAISPGVDRNFFYPRSEAEVRAMRNLYGLAKKYILFVGTQEPRKNLGGLYQAWRVIHLEHPEVQLVVAGGQDAHFNSDRREAFHPGVRQLGYFAEAGLPALYSGALAFILPSHYEGFGLSALEAMACGAPVVVSRTAALPEVVGKAGFMVDPARVEELVEVVCWLISDPELREVCSQRSLERANQFDRGLAAKKVWDVLQDTHSQSS